MLIKRYEAEVNIHKDPEVNHFNKFLKKIKKRQNKRQESSTDELPTKRKRVTEEVINENIENDVPLVKKSFNKGSTSDSFTIIGDHSFSKNNKVKPVLPKWLSNPEVIMTDLSQASSEMPEFNSKISLNLKGSNISNFFPVQQSVIPWVINQSNRADLVCCNYVSQDICVSSPTGSGKTLAYVLPIVQGLINRLVPRVRCLVVVPVQELAEQVAKVFRDYSKGTNLRVEAITGGKSLQLEQTKLIKTIKGIGEDSYESLVDIVAVTPGRLVEHLQKTKGFSLKDIKYLVIDEADRIMDGIQNDWLFYLEKHLGHEIFSSLSLNYLKKRKTKFQKLLFSATLSQDPEKLKKLNLFQPVLFTSVNKNELQSNDPLGKSEESMEIVGKFVMPQELEEFYVTVENYVKPIVIAELLTSYKWRMVLCFCKSGSEAHRLSKLISFMCPSLKIRDISSLLHKSSRNQVLNQFNMGKIDMLVSSDVMARGIDIPKVRYVISYDPPKHLRGYVHRAGRTGRAGMPGTVLTITTPTQTGPFIQRLKEVNKVKINEMKINPDIYQKRSKNFKDALKKLKSQSESNERKTPHLREFSKKKRKMRKRS